MVFKKINLILIAGTLICSFDHAFCESSRTGEELARPPEAIQFENFAPQVAVPATIKLNETAEINEPLISFEKIGTCSGNSKICEEIYGVDFGSLAQAGQSRILALSDVKDILKKEFPDAMFVFVGAQKTRVLSQSTEIEKDMVAENLGQELSKIFEGIETLKTEVNSLQMLSNVKVWSGEYTLRFPLFENIKETNEIEWIISNLSGPKTLDVEYMPDNSAVPSQKFQIHVQFLIKRLLPMTVIDLEKGELLGPEHLKMGWYSINRLTNTPVTDLEKLVGLKTKRRIRAGSPLTSEMVENPIAIKRGQLVRMVLKKGDLYINSRAKAMGPGSLGEQIKVLFAPTKKEILATVIDSSTVEVVE